MSLLEPRKGQASRLFSTRLRLPGQVILLAAALMLLAAWNSGYNLYYLVFAGLASFLLASFLFSRWSVAGLELQREAPSAVSRGDRFPVTVRVRNTKRFLPALSLHLESADASTLSEGYVLAIPSGWEAVLTGTAQFDRRGVHLLPELEAVTAFPFGLLERRRRLRDRVEVLVFPRVRAIRPAALEQAQSGATVSKSGAGEDDEFFSLRDYHPGDDLRKVAWRPSAKANALLVKELKHDASRAVACVLDNRLRQDLAEFEELFEEAVELTASLAVTLLNLQYPVTLLTASGSLPLGEGPSHATKVLEFLARLEAASPSAPNPFTEAVARDTGRRLRFLFVAPDPGLWGRFAAPGAARVLHPKEVIHA